MIKVFPNIEELNFFAAEKFVEIGRRTVGEDGRFSVALSGGSTPKALFKLLSSNNFKDKVDWSKVFFFFGDERSVFPDHDESNFKMARENLFEPLKIAEKNVFRWQTELETASAIAEDYTQILHGFFGDSSNLSARFIPRFDLIFLGMGADGHTASLFPFTPALLENEKIAVANRVDKLNTTRLTLTFPTINNARNVIFLVAGADKAASLQKVLRGEFEPEKFPSQKVKPKNGELFWLIDKKAAGDNGDW